MSNLRRWISKSKNKEWNEKQNIMQDKCIQNIPQSILFFLNLDLQISAQ